MAFDFQHLKLNFAGNSHIKGPKYDKKKEPLMVETYRGRLKTLVSDMWVSLPTFDS